MVDLSDDAVLAESTRTVIERFAPEKILLFGRQVVYSRVTSEPRRVREERGDPPESLSEWVSRAEVDFRMAEIGADSGFEVNDAVVFHAHQAVEKLLKAASVRERRAPLRTHDLTRLLERVAPRLRDDPALRAACAALQALVPRSRYPAEPTPANDDVAQALRWVRRAREIVLSAIAG